MLANITILPIVSGNGTETEEADFRMKVCLEFWVDYYILIDTFCQELMKSVGSHVSLPLPFLMRDNLTCCDSHKVMTSRIIIMKFWFS